MFAKIQLGICTVYMFFSLGFTVIFAAQYWDAWSFNTLALKALAYGFTWAMWMLT